MNKRTLFIAAAVTVMVLPTALPAQEEDPQALGAETSAGVTAEVTADSAETGDASVPETLRHKDRAATIMDTPLDGSSVESFTEGLNKLDQEDTEEEYRQVMSALDFLLFYDIGARRKKDLLYARLDGMTPNQILERVQSHRAKPAKAVKADKE